MSWCCLLPEREHGVLGDFCVGSKIPSIGDASSHETVDDRASVLTALSPASRSSLAQFDGGQFDS